MTRARSGEPGRASDVGEPAGSGSPASGTVPVQETNILHILETHLPAEHALVVARIREIEEQLTAAQKYQIQLEAIAGQAGVVLQMVTV
jgi:hypothetical protein